MASSLELGKLVGASFLYRYWTTINLWMKSYLLVAVVTLIGITSAGIFGFLSNAYQGATVTFEKETSLLSYNEDRLEILIEDRDFLKEEMIVTVNALPDNYVTAKRKIREEYNPKIQNLNTQILNIKSEISDLKVSLIDTGVDVGPAIYLAKVFDTDIDTVVKFFILILIFVFDPLAVILVVSANVAIIDRDKGKRIQRERIVKEEKSSKLEGLFKAAVDRTRGIFKKNKDKDLYDEKDSKLGDKREIGNAPISYHESDLNKDGIVTEEERLEWEHNKKVFEEEEEKKLKDMNQKK